MKNNNIDNTISPLPRNLKIINFSKISKFKNIKPSDNVKGYNLLQNLLIFDMIESLHCILQFFFHLHYSIRQYLFVFFWYFVSNKVRDLGSKFSNEILFCEAACVLCYILKIPFLTPIRLPFYDGKQKRNFLVAVVIETAQPFQSQEILRPQAQNLAMRLAWRGCLRPCYILEIPILPPMRHHLMMANKKEFPSSSSD